MAQASGAGSGQAGRTQSVRATLAYRGQDLRLVDRRVVVMRAPPSHDLQPRERQAGFWFQVEDAGGRPLYRRVMHNPVRFDAETPSDDPDRPLMRVPLPEPEGVFYLLIPLLRDAKTVRVFSSPFDPGKQAEPAREILVFGVFQQPEQEPPPTGTQPPGKRRRRKPPGGGEGGEGAEGSQDQGTEES